MAYRVLDPAVALETLWSREDRNALFLYVHIPFCEMRCGFCNLFTTTNAAPSQVDSYFSALERQMETVGKILGPHCFGRAAFGGGTPTFLSEAEIVRLFALLDKYLRKPAPGTPVSFEMSPATVTPLKMRLLRELGVTRASLGVQSFLLEETRSLGRPQDIGEVFEALDCMRNAGFPVLNIDLIYGAQNQTPNSWRHSLQSAISYAPEEIYLYPLYVRPLTGLNRARREPSDIRIDLYREAREFLLENGYLQISMRLFRRAKTSAQTNDGPVYCCQEDGMLGFGPGARSYTRELHYSSEYAVGRSGIQEIIREYAGRTHSQFGLADYGCVLDADEQRRRYVIKSILRNEGLDQTLYAARFSSDPLCDFPELNDLFEHGLATHCGTSIRLTPAGIERSDTIGPWLFSPRSNALIEQYELV
ncbi:MAG: Fe-S oxidoreductase, coproporphyrinogen oxidase [Chthoniobacteraceae bacterium]|nr:Fe-S oxidoreductase, coproporphyrinogen oxidase [Chthoniobacteraceae bacterium]